MDTEVFKEGGGEGVTLNLQVVIDKNDDNLELHEEGIFKYYARKVIVKDGIKQVKGIQKRELEDLKYIVQSKFFTPDMLEKTIVKLNYSGSKIPWRGIDFGIVNHAKSNITSIESVSNGETSVVDPYIQYNSLLESKHRLLFDPFRRGSKIFFTLNDIVYRTTVAQLDFVKWCYEHNILQFIENNKDRIKKHIVDVGDQKKTANKKRRILTAARSSCIRGGITSSFDICTETEKEVNAEKKALVDLTLQK